MGRLAFISLFLGAFLVLAAPAFAEQPYYVSPNYLTGKIGAYFPTGDLDDLDFDAGINAEVALGHSFSPNLALEGAVGFFQTEADLTFSGIKEEDEVWAVPLTATLKAIAPMNTAQFYVGAGGGLYFVTADVKLTDLASGLSASDDDNDVVVGGHLLAGLTADVSPNFFFGLEGKYIFTSQADFTVFGAPLEASLDGFMLTGNVGIRF
jgi:opacity protein-like surface antigen